MDQNKPTSEFNYQHHEFRGKVIHSRGPWYTDFNTRVPDYPYLILSDRGQVARVTSEEDARVISATPELLEALQGLVCAAAYYANQFPRDEQIRADLDKAAAAIRKATGGNCP